MPTLKKALADLTSEDLTAVLVERWPEDEQLEFKQALPANSDEGDRWVTHGDRIGDRAKNGVFSEVVAFANSYGGDLVLGIQETDGNPRCAEKRTPIPRCNDLAEQLAMAARDLIEPQIPRLEFRGIPINETGEGYVVIRVHKSQLAPHRLRSNKECYRRRGGSSEPMTMREIQDLTFSVARGLEGVDRRLTELKKDFDTWLAENDGQGWKSFAVRVSALPITSDLYIERVHEVKEIAPSRKVFFAKLGEQDTRRFDLNPLLTEHQQWRPILRGTQANDGDARNSPKLTRLQLTCDGAVSYHFLRRNRTGTVEADLSNQWQFLLYPGWVFGLLLNALDTVDRIRTYSSAHSTEYALEVEITSAEPLPVMRMMSDGSLQDTAGTLPRRTKLPRYAVGGVDSRHDLLNLVWNDFWNSVGIDAKNDQFKLIQ
jgi:hypothetical protein